jgi:GntR family transcriptional regulator
MARHLGTQLRPAQILATILPSFAIVVLLLAAKGGALDTSVYVYQCLNTHVRHRPRARMFILNPQSGIPIYRQLVEQAKRLIAGGQLPAGSELPSVRELAVEHSVNPMTISRAYALLEQEGFLERQRGKPMRVAAGRRNQAALPKRLQQIERSVEELVLAARQLELAKKDVAKLLSEKWEDGDG